MKNLLAHAVALLFAGAVIAAQSSAPGTDDRPNESRAVGTTRTLNTAQAYYSSHYSDQGFACSLAQMGEDGSGKPTAEAAGLITKELVSGHVEGYRIAVNCGGEKPYRRVTVQAVPANPASGARAFCSDLYLTADNKLLGGVINFATDGKAETCFIKGAPLVPPAPPRDKLGY